MQEMLGVIVGSALGGTARFWLSGVIDQRYGAAFPWGTLLVNVSGAFLIGVLATLLYPGPETAGFSGLPWWHVGVIGFLGSYTTVSSFSLQTLALLQHGKRREALRNVALSLGLCLTFVALGFWAAGNLAGRA